MDDAAPPLLRTPPFPGVDPEIAAVSHRGAGHAISAERLATLLAAIRVARVGGTFWAPPIPDPGGPLLILRPRSRDEAWAMRAEPAGGSHVVLSLPDAAWARDFNDGDATIVRGERDPWSVLRPGARLIAADDDEWSTIAAIAGAEREGAPLDLSRLGADHAYRDCFTGVVAEPERIVAILGEWRRTLDANRSIAVAAGIAWWKKPAIERLLWTGRTTPLLFEDDPDTAVATAHQRSGGIAYWPAKAPGVCRAAAAAGVEAVAIEDGFIRSVGLGVDLHPPLSIVVDRSGVYYDPASASDLEMILERSDMSPALLQRAARLRQAIVEGGISKYARSAPAPAPAPRMRRTVLVAGQVEDDASVRLGGGGIGNFELLRQARAAEPDALILFKPHPDVDAGHRRGAVPDRDILGLADEIVRAEAMPRLLGRIDAVHVLSSLTGFEALLRGLDVCVDGQPFYAGWGLTTDLGAPLPRRTRHLTLDMLVAGALILYPRYLDPVTGLPCPPEILLERLAGGWKPRRSLLVTLRRLQGRIARALGLWTSGPKRELG